MRVMILKVFTSKDFAPRLRLPIDIIPPSWDIGTYLNIRIHDQIYICLM